MSTFDRALQAYPYLADKDIHSVTTINPKDNRFLEFYPPDEPGSPQYPRPKELPMGKVGIQILSNKTRPIDVLADYVSHHAVNADPTLQSLYAEFEANVDPNVLRQRYEQHRKKFGEKRPYEIWKERTGLPELFRGYTFNQWDNAEQMYTPTQLGILNRVRDYVGVK
jgi:hypothetical protein